MVSILDNKKTAELVIEKSLDSYEKINPESLATIIENNGRQENDNDLTVQEHINNSKIHLTKDDVISYTEKYLTLDNVIEGDNITLEKDSEGNTVRISTTYVDSKSYMTPSSLVPQDTTITITPIEDTDNKVYIRANIPDVSHFLVPSNIRAKDDTIQVYGEKYSNNVYIQAKQIGYSAGSGLRLEGNTFVNALPDKEVVLNAGTNVFIEGEYPEFTISAENRFKVAAFDPSETYVKDVLVTYNNGLYVCIVDESTPGAFNPEEWSMLAGYEMFRKTIVIEESTDTIDLTPYGINPILDKNSLIVNIGGVLQSSDNYTIQPNGLTIQFIEAIPSNSSVEVMILGNTIMDAHDSTANITDWESNVYYNVGNVVIHNNGLWKCLEKHASGITFDATKWQLLAGYVKKIHTFHTDEETTQIILPEIVYSNSDLMINVGNTLLMNNTYKLGPDGKKITFEEPIEAGTDIEVTILTHGVVADTQVPNPNGKRNQYVMSNDRGTGYVLYNREDFMKQLQIHELYDPTSHSNCVFGSAEDGSGFKWYNPQELASKAGIRNTANGLTVRSLGTNLVEIASGSVIDSTESVLMRLIQPIIKNFGAAWEYGTNKGSMLGTIDNPWTQPNTTEDTEARLRVFTTEYQSDREGWRAIDAHETDGNGWLANTTSAMWEYDSPFPIKITKFRFVNQTSGLLNVWSKDIDLWVSNDEEPDIVKKEKIIVGSFTAKGEDLGETVYEIENPQYARVFGFTVNDSYGQGVGAKHVEMTGFAGSTLSQNVSGYIYIISNRDGTVVDIATSTYTGEEFEALLPEGFTNYALIGQFSTDGSSNVIDLYPSKDLATSFFNKEILTSDILNVIYPIGSAYTTFNETCPLQTLIEGSEWELQPGDSMKVFKRVK